MEDIPSKLTALATAFEFWDQAAIGLVKQHLTVGANDPLQSAHPFYVLIETSGSNKDHDDEKLGAYLENLLTDGVVEDGVVAQDTTQILNLWAIREGIPEACSKAGAIFKYDISMPVPVLYQAVEDMRTRLESLDAYGEGKPFTSVIGYGHVGDASHRGSISAEHGLGISKNEHLHYSKSGPMIKLMKRFKDMIDPNGIMNPYKYLPEKIE
ncbi:hypothetical protein BGZ83_008584 [Gryganskiella cystojenkinii]|nr:hypothetical protein BGZ83_008584 [Gryganskiella cystojenkinii]